MRASDSRSQTKDRRHLSLPTQIAAPLGGESHRPSFDSGGPSTSMPSHRIEVTNQAERREMHLMRSKMSLGLSMTAANK